MVLFLLCWGSEGCFEILLKVFFWCELQGSFCPHKIDRLRSNFSCPETPYGEMFCCWFSFKPYFDSQLEQSLFEFAGKLALSLLLWLWCQGWWNIYLSFFVSVSSSHRLFKASGAENGKPSPLPPPSLPAHLSSGGRRAVGVYCGGGKVVVVTATPELSPKKSEKAHLVKLLHKEASSQGFLDFVWIFAQGSEWKPAAMSPFLRIGFSNFEIDPGLAYHEEVLNPYCAVYMKEAIDTG